MNLNTNSELDNIKEKETFNSIFDWPYVPKAERIQEDNSLLTDQGAAIENGSYSSNMLRVGLNNQSTSNMYHLKNYSNIVNIVPINLPNASFRALQKWEGYVVKIKKDCFIARLSVISGEGSEQEAKISIDELDNEEKKLLHIGAIFYWSIGYYNKPSGRENTSIIRFRRLPAWTHEDLNRAIKSAEELRVLLNDTD